MSNHKEPESGSASLARKRREFTVAASPLNTVKLDLAILLVLAVLVLVLVTALIDSHAQQFLWLGGFGMLALVWLVLRVRRVLRRHQIQPPGVDDEA